MILYFAADLLWASKIKATADALGIACRPVRSAAMLDARLADSPVRALLVDLDKAEEALALIARVRDQRSTIERHSADQHAASGPRRVRVLAWGPHVEKELLRRARDAGADEVLTRGAFDHGMEAILIGLAASGSVEHPAPRPG